MFGGRQQLAVGTVVARSVEFPGSQSAVDAPERLDSVNRRPAKVARPRGLVKAFVRLFRALESNVVGQGVGTLHGHNNSTDPLYLKREHLVGRILPVLSVVVDLKAFLS